MRTQNTDDSVGNSSDGPHPFLSFNQFPIQGTLHPLCRLTDISTNSTTILSI